MAFSAITSLFQRRTRVCSPYWTYVIQFFRLQRKIQDVEVKNSPGGDPNRGLVCYRGLEVVPISGPFIWSGFGSADVLQVHGCSYGVVQSRHLLGYTWVSRSTGSIAGGWTPDSTLALPTIGSTMVSLLYLGSQLVLSALIASLASPSVVSLSVGSS